MILKGEVHPDFGGVCDALIRTIPNSGEGGSALCIYHHGEKVADIWGGHARSDGTPWQEDTITFSGSSSKAVVSTLMHILVDRGLAAYDDKVSEHWPEFAQNGKQNITIRHILTHQSGLHSLASLDIVNDDIKNWDYAVKKVETMTPAFVPGTESTYQGVTYGHVLGGVIEKIANKPFKQVLQDELIDPLGLDGLYIGVPQSEWHRLAEVFCLRGHIAGAVHSHRRVPEKYRPLFFKALKFFGIDFHRFLDVFPEHIREINFNQHEYMEAMLPAGNGGFTARSLAKLYAMIVNGGEIDGTRILSPSIVQQLGTVQSNQRDKALGFNMQWRLGYHRLMAMHKQIPQGFGHYGLGGCWGICDPQRGLAIGYTSNTARTKAPFDRRNHKIVLESIIKSADQRDGFAKDTGIKPITSLS